MAQSPQAARDMGKAGRERIESEFTMERTVEKTSALYLKLLDRRQAGATSN